MDLLRERDRLKVGDRVWVRAPGKWKYRRGTVKTDLVRVFVVELEGGLGVWPFDAAMLERAE